MLFLIANPDTSPTLFVFLTEADCNDMRSGRTKFINQDVLKGHRFSGLVVSLHKHQAEIEEGLKRAGHGALLEGMPSPTPQPGEAECAGCGSIVPEPLLLHGKCITCWYEQARRAKMGPVA